MNSYPHKTIVLNIVFLPTKQDCICDNNFWCFISDGLTLDEIFMIIFMDTISELFFQNKGLYNLILPMSSSELPTKKLTIQKR